jgi:hypothetical protein
VRVNKSQAAQTGVARASAADIREFEPEGIADDNVLDLAASVQQHTDLSARFT